MGETMRLVGSAGEIEASPGDRFKWWDGTEWELVGPADGWNYSPSGLGGCPSVTLRHVRGDLDPVMQRYTADGLSVWCGDSVATGIINSRKRESTRPLEDRDIGEREEGC